MPRERAPHATALAAPVGKDRLTVHLPVDLIEGVKNAVYWTPGLTLARLAEDAWRPGPRRTRSRAGGTVPAPRALPDRGTAAALSGGGGVPGDVY